jgi:hypothetical protein
VEADKRIEDEELGAQRGDGVGETVAITLDVEPDRGCGNHVDVQIGELEAGGVGQASEPPTHDVERIFRGEEQYAARLRRPKATQTRHASGDRDGHVEREKRRDRSMTAGCEIRNPSGNVEALARALSRRAAAESARVRRA